MLFGDELMLGVDGDLNIVADAHTARRMHRTAVWIRQRYLILRTLCEVGLAGFKMNAPFPHLGDLCLQIFGFGWISSVYVVLVRDIQLLQIAIQLLFAFAEASLQLCFCEITIPAIYGLQAGAIDGNQLAAVQIELPAENNERPEDLSECGPVVTPEVSDRFEIGRKTAHQPDDLNVAPCFSFQASAGPHPVKIP